MDILKLKWTMLQMEVFQLLCLKAGQKLSQREIALALNVSPTAVGNSLSLLLKRSLAVVEKMKTIHFVSLNRNEPTALGLKRVENLKQIYLSGLLGYFISELAGGTIVLFGSYARGEDVFSSDIDIVVVGRKSKMLLLDKFERVLQRKIHVQFFTSWAAIDSHVRNNILNGIVLEGSVSV